MKRRSGSPAAARTTCSSHTFSDSVVPMTRFLGLEPHRPVRLTCETLVSVRGQCSDGAADPTAARTGVQTLDRVVRVARDRRRARRLLARRPRPRDRSGPADRVPARDRVRAARVARSRPRRPLPARRAPGGLGRAGCRQQPPGRCGPARARPPRGDDGGEHTVVRPRRHAPDLRRGARTAQRPARHRAAGRGDAAHQGFGRQGAAGVGTRSGRLRRRARDPGRRARAGVRREHRRARGGRGERERTGLRTRRAGARGDQRQRSGRAAWTRAAIGRSRARCSTRRRS